MLVLMIMPEKQHAELQRSSDNITRTQKFLGPFHIRTVFLHESVIIYNMLYYIRLGAELLNKLKVVPVTCIKQHYHHS